MNNEWMGICALCGTRKVAAGMRGAGCFAICCSKQRRIERILTVAFTIFIVMHLCLSIRCVRVGECVAYAEFHTIAAASTDEYN